MKYLRRFKRFSETIDESLSNESDGNISGEDVKTRFSENIIQIKTTVSDQKIKEYQEQYLDKWILFNKELGFIWIKDKPRLFNYSVPKKVYHVSGNPNLDKIGIQPSTKSSTPFGYYNFSFFYLNLEDVEYGSIPYMKGENYLYEVSTNIPDVEWYEGFNEPIDGEENITTNSFIEPDYIIKIESEFNIISSEVKEGILYNDESKWLEIAEVLSTECSEFIGLLKKWNIEGIYRGQKMREDGNITDGFWKFTPRVDRTPRDTKSEISKLLDEGLKKKFGIPLRSNGVFASKDISIADDYGNQFFGDESASFDPLYSGFRPQAATFLFFPKNGFRYFWNPKINDLYTELRDNRSWYNKEPFFWNSSEQRDFQEIIDGYQEGEIEKIKRQEITFICDEYYLLDEDYCDQFIDYFIR